MHVYNLKNATYDRAGPVAGRPKAAGIDCELPANGRSVARHLYAIGRLADPIVQFCSRGRKAKAMIKCMCMIRIAA